jgi:hypothetical protein
MKHKQVSFGELHFQHASVRVVRRVPNYIHSATSQRTNENISVVLELKYTKEKELSPLYYALLLSSSYRESIGKKVKLSF